VIGESLQFQRNPSQGAGSRRSLSTAKRLDVLAVCRRVTHRRIPCQGLYLVNRTFSRSTQERTFNPPMLVSQGNLQVKHMLPMALKPEMPRLNDPRVHWTYRYLVDLFAFHSRKIVTPPLAPHPGAMPSPDR
jgi:hypothetical protein